MGVDEARVARAAVAVRGRRITRGVRTAAHGVAPAFVHALAQIRGVHALHRAVPALGALGSIATRGAGRGLGPLPIVTAALHAHAFHAAYLRGFTRIAHARAAAGRARAGRTPRTHGAAGALHVAHALRTAGLALRAVVTHATRRAAAHGCSPRTVRTAGLLRAGVHGATQRPWHANAAATVRAAVGTARVCAPLTFRVTRVQASIGIRALHLPGLAHAARARAAALCALAGDGPATVVTARTDGLVQALRLSRLALGAAPRDAAETAALGGGPATVAAARALRALTRTPGLLRRALAADALNRAHAAVPARATDRP